MDRKAVDEDGLTLLCRHLAKALKENEKKRRLLIVQTCMEAHHYEVDENVDVRDYMRVEWRKC